MTLTIGVPLFKATSKALEKLSGHFPPAVFPKLQLDDERRDEYIRDWAGPLIGVSLDAIIDAARRWIGDPDKVVTKAGEQRLQVPTAASFAMYARNVDFEYYRPKLVLEPQRPSNADTSGMRDEMQRRAEASLGNRELAQEVWGFLWKSATTDERRQQVREGRVSMDDFDDAIRIVRESSRTQRRGA